MRDVIGRLKFLHPDVRAWEVEDGEMPRLPQDHRSSGIRDYLTAVLNPDPFWM